MDKHQEYAASSARSTPQPSAPHIVEPSTMDSPPSYAEAMNHPIVETARQPSVTPSAPILEVNATNPYPYNPYNAQSQPAQQYPPYPYAQTNGQFSGWDENATRILIMQRLEMEERFRKARNEQEREMLWNIILTDLYMSGYHDFLLVDLIRFWGFQFHIYKSIIDGLSGGSHTDTNWQYFQPMDNVYKGSTEGLGSTLEAGSSILEPSSNILTVPPVSAQPLVPPDTTSTIQPVTDGPSIAANVSDTSNPISTDTATIIGGGDNPILATLSATQTNDTINETVPLPIPSNGVGDGVSAALASNTDDVASGLTDIGSIQASIPSEPLLGTASLNDVTGASAAITTQPDSLGNILSVDGDVITSQPLSMGLPSVDQPLEPISNDDGCCGGDGCCGDDGCFEDEGCCGGDGYDGCGEDGCDGCEDCDCDC